MITDLTQADALQREPTFANACTRCTTLEDVQPRIVTLIKRTLNAQIRHSTHTAPCVDKRQLTSPIFDVTERIPTTI